MTEKRFVKYVHEEWSVIFDNEEITSLNLDETIDTLNELNDENEQLKSENRLLKGRIQEYEEMVMWND